MGTIAQRFIWVFYTWDMIPKTEICFIIFVIYYIYYSNLHWHYK